MKYKADTVAFVVANDVLKQHVEAIMHEQIAQGKVIVEKLDVQNIEQGGRKLVDDGIAAIIARGGTYVDLKRDIKRIPVIKVDLSAADILFSLEKAKRQYQQIYLVLHESILFDFDSWRSLLDIQLAIYRYSGPEQLKSVLENLEFDEDTVVVGSGASADLSKKKNINTIEILPRDDNYITAYENAHVIISQMKREKSQINLLESIMYAVGDGVIVIDENGLILHFNRRSEELLGIQSRMVVRKYIHQIMDFSKFEKYLKVRPFEERQTVLTVNNRVLSVRLDLFQIYEDEVQFVLTLNDVTRIQELEQDIRRKLSKKGLVAKYTFDDILTNNKVLKDSIEKAKSMASYDGSVLIFGESGTGKELFAQSIHNASPRANGPFVAVNCAALAESLLESELFGYVSGAFTGAKKEGKAGLFELAHGGTIFLDEINSMPLSLQAKVLRVIEQKEVMRIGSDYVIPLNVRILAATNEKIRSAVVDKTFRQDLYFRLNTFEVRIPPLRERKEDILMLFKFYLDEYRGFVSDDVEISPDFEQMLLTHDWLGNVRELKSTALRYHAFDGDNHNNDILEVSRAKDDFTVIDEDMRIDLNQLNKTIETLVIQNLLDKNIKKNEIAKLLGISRQALYKKLNNIYTENDK